MSATFDKRDGAIFAPKICNKLEQEMFSAYFDQQVDYDLAIMKKEMEETKLLRKMSLVKILVFPILYPLTRIFIGKALADDVLYCQKLYWKFLRKKITPTEFKNLLTKVKSKT